MIGQQPEPVDFNKLLTILIEMRINGNHVDVACVGAMLIAHAIAVAPAKHQQSMFKTTTNWIRKRLELAE